LDGCGPEPKLGLRFSAVGPAERRQQPDGGGSEQLLMTWPEPTNQRAYHATDTGYQTRRKPHPWCRLAGHINEKQHELVHCPETTAEQVLVPRAARGQGEQVSRHDVGHGDELETPGNVCAKPSGGEPEQRASHARGVVIMWAENRARHSYDRVEPQRHRP